MAKKVKKKMFKLKNKDEVEEFLKSQGFEVRVEREEEELDEGIVGVFEKLTAFKNCGDYHLEILYEVYPDSEKCTVEGGRGFCITALNVDLDAEGVEGLSKAIKEVSEKVEAKIKEWFGGVSTFGKAIEEMGFKPSILMKDRVETSVDIREEGGRYHGYIRMLADHNGVAVHVQLWELGPAKGLEVVRKVVEALKSAGLKLAQLQL
jgi:hypothetical protein